MVEWSDERKWDEHLAGQPYRKDLGCGRTKGVWLEDMLDKLVSRYALKLVGGYTGTSSYYEHYYVGDGIRLAWAYHRLSVPGLVISTDTKERYHKIREFLRGQGLYR